MEDVVFDYYPAGTPHVLTDHIQRTIETSSITAPAGAGWDAMLDSQIRELETDESYRQQLLAPFLEAGIDLFSPTVWSLDVSQSFSEGVSRDLSRWQARFDMIDRLRKVRSPAEARETAADGDVGAVLNVQDVGSFTAGDPSRVDQLFNAGVRIAQLTYNRHNGVGAGCTERADEGLTHHGVAVLRRLTEHGAIVDVSHCGPTTTMDAIDTSTVPIAITHAVCAKVTDHVRAKSDRILRALADNDGYMGISALPVHVAPDADEPTLDDFCDHVDHAISVLGTERVGIGTDWGMNTPDVPGALHDDLLSFFKHQGFDEDDVVLGEGLGEFQVYTDWKAIPEKLRDRGYDENEVRAICGGNFLRFWERVAVPGR